MIIVHRDLFDILDQWAETFGTYGRLVNSLGVPVTTEHEDSETCWCHPVIVSYDDPRSTEQIVRDAMVIVQ